MDDALGLPRLSEILKSQPGMEMENSIEQLPELLETTKKLDAALSSSANSIDSDFEAHDREMDELSKVALRDYEKLMDLGFNVEPRVAGTIFDPAVNMLKLVMDAKTAKIDKKLKLMRIELEKKKLEMAKTESGFQDAEEAFVVADRNKLLEAIKKQSSNK